jgi:hypothetical protein
VVNGLELLLLLMQCKDGNLFFRPPFVSFYASKFPAIYPGLYMLSIPSIQPGLGLGFLVSLPCGCIPRVYAPPSLLGPFGVAFWVFPFRICGQRATYSCHGN